MLGFDTYARHMINTNKNKEFKSEGYPMWKHKYYTYYIDYTCIQMYLFSHEEVNI